MSSTGSPSTAGGRRALLIAGLLLCGSFAAPCQAQPAQTPAPARIEVPSYGEVFTRMLLLLGGTVILLFIAARLMPRWFANAGRAGAGRIIQVIESRRLEPKKGLYLVRVADRYLLLGTSEQRIDVLAGGELDQVAIAALDETPATGRIDAEARSFVSELRRATAASPAADEGRSS